MKKLLIVLTILSFGINFAASAETENEYQNENNTQVEQKLERKFGGSIGVRLSILGVEPTVSFIGGKTELEVYCPVLMIGSSFIKDLKWDNFLMGPGASIGMLSSPFETGFQNGFGAAYNYYFTGDLHAWSLYYKLGVRFRDGSNIMVRTMWPMAMMQKGEIISILSPDYLLGSYLISYCLFSIGYRHYF
ncbi:MAG: hypothetical protein HUK25_08580 [Treponema sp.]|nr:hypothetical protein [Treponema sp.]